MAPVRSTAEERRDEIVAAASHEFAHAGFAGTSTDAIAKRVGVAQPYLFQLVGTKKDLFLAAVRACFGRTRRTFEDANRAATAQGLDKLGVLQAMGHAYFEQIADRDQLRMQLQAYAACGDPEIREVVREELMSLMRWIGEVTGATPEELHYWLAEGMLMNVIAVVSDTSTAEEFACELMGVPVMKH